MYKWKRVLAISLVLMFAAGISPVFAQARYGLTPSDAIEVSTSLVAPAGSWVYGWTIFADAGNAYAGLYDCATFYDGANTTVVDEIGEATQWDKEENWFTKPIYFTNGVSVVMPSAVGVVVVWTGPEPN